MEGANAEVEENLPPSHCWIALSFLGHLDYLFRNLLHQYTKRHKIIIVKNVEGKSCLGSQR